MLDTKGPEIRLGTFAGGSAVLEEDSVFTLTADETEGDATRAHVSYAELPSQIKPGTRILLDDGNIELLAEKCTGSEIVCRVVEGGVIKNGKGVNVPNVRLDMPHLSERDKDDLLFGIQNDVDFVAASFVSRRQDLVDLKDFLRANGGGDIDVIAKIENQSGGDNIDEICTACEGVMVARGDLGVEVPFTELPAIQKYLITKCRMLGKRVITATEMLESMITNPRPTRAEISDVANAVYDGTSAIMLSGESAAGKYPVEALRIMGEIAEETEKHIDYIGQFRTRDFVIRNRVDAISHAACTMAIDLDAKAIVVTSLSGITVRMVSRFRAPITILGLATSKRVWYKLAMSWGVLPLLTEQFPNIEVLNFYSLRAAKDALQLADGDTVVMTGGDTSGESGNTNVIRIEMV